MNKPTISGVAIAAECQTETVPLEFSIRGTNSFYFPCEMLKRQSCYAVCLHTINSERKGALGKSSPCLKPIGSGACPALTMRKQEEEAGKALFFEDRAKRVQAFTTSSADSGMAYGKRGAALAAFRANEANRPAKPASPPVAVVPKRPPSWEKNFPSTKETVAPKATPKKESGLDAGLLGRNLLGEAIESMMGGDK